MKWTALALLVLAPAALAPAAPLELKKGDHISVIGNTLADRMQHHGWLETMIHNRFPRHELVFRNLGFSGDEVKTRNRSMDFGTPDQWLSASAPIPQPGKLVNGHQRVRVGVTQPGALVGQRFFQNLSRLGEPAAVRDGARQVPAGAVRRAAGALPSLGAIQRSKSFEGNESPWR